MAGKAKNAEAKARFRQVARDTMLQAAAAARWVPTLLLAAATVALYASGLADEISLDSVQANEIHLRQEVAAK